MAEPVVPLPDRPHGVHRIDTSDPVPVRSVPDLVREAILVLPQLTLLVARLLRDARVPLRRKLVAGAAAAYLIAPIDLIPDFVPVAGQVDDVIFAAFAINHLMNSVPSDVQAEYWAGSEDALDLVRSLVAWGAEMVPKPLRKLV